MTEILGFKGKSSDETIENKLKNNKEAYDKFGL